jgi:hypothetical protein
VRNVTTCFGKNSFPDDLWKLLDQSRPDKVLIAVGIKLQAFCMLRQKESLSRDF